MIKSKTFDFGIFGFAFFMFFYSIIYSLPSFIIINLINLYKIKLLNIQTKITLSIILIILMLLTNLIVFGKQAYNLEKNYSGLTFSIIFTISIVLATSIIKLKKIQNK